MEFSKSVNFSQLSNQIGYITVLQSFHKFDTRARKEPEGHASCSSCGEHQNTNTEVSEHKTLQHGNICSQCSSIPHSHWQQLDQNYHTILRYTTATILMHQILSHCITFYLCILIAILSILLCGSNYYSLSYLTIVFTIMSHWICYYHTSKHHSLSYLTSIVTIISHTNRFCHILQPQLL